VRADLSHNAISRIERGEVNPKLETVERLAVALDISVEDYNSGNLHLMARRLPENYDNLLQRINSLPERERTEILKIMESLIDLATRAK